MSDDDAGASVLLLGDAGVGKTAFLSRLLLGAAPSHDSDHRGLQDGDQPFVMELKSRQGAHRVEFSDTASPTSYALLRPTLIILCYAIPERTTLKSIIQHWKHLVETHFNYDESLPVMLLGLKRDLRKEKQEDGGQSIMPQEAVRVAQEMRVDRYAECSAMTGDMWDLAVKDVLKMAVGSVKSGRGKTPGTSCLLM